MDKYILYKYIIFFFNVSLLNFIVKLIYGDDYLINIQIAKEFIDKKDKSIILSLNFDLLDTFDMKEFNYKEVFKRYLSISNNKQLEDFINSGSVEFNNVTVRKLSDIFNNLCEGLNFIIKGRSCYPFIVR